MPRDNCPQCERLKAELEKVRGELREAEARNERQAKRLARFLVLSDEGVPEKVDRLKELGEEVNAKQAADDALMGLTQRMEKALRLTQWAGSDSRGYYCMECGNDVEEGHDRGCIVGQALSREGSESDAS